MFRHASHRATLIHASASIVVIALVSSACASRVATTAPATRLVTSIPTAAAPRVAGRSNAVAGTLDLASLTGRYQSGSDPTQVLDLLPDGSAYLVGATDVRKDAYSISADRITFSGESCDGTKGTYQGSVQRGGDLALTVVDDTCLERAALLSVKLVGPLSRLRAQFPYASMQRSQTLHQPQDASWTVDVAGNLWATNHAGEVNEYRPDGSGIRSWLTGLVSPSGVTVDAKGDVYVSDFSDASVNKFTSTGEPILSWKVGGGVQGPTGVAHDAAGDIYVVLHRTHDHYVEKYSSTGKLIRSWGTTGQGDGEIGASDDSGPEAIAVDAAGNNYVNDLDNNRTVKFDPKGKFLLNIGGDGTPTFANVAVDSKGNVYASDNLTIWKFDPSGKVIGEWFCPYSIRLVIDTHDNIFGVGNEIIALRLPAT